MTACHIGSYSYIVNNCQFLYVNCKSQNKSKPSLSGFPNTAALPSLTSLSSSLHDRESLLSVNWLIILEYAGRPFGSAFL